MFFSEKGQDMVGADARHCSSSIAALIALEVFFAPPRNIFDLVCFVSFETRQKNCHFHYLRRRELPG